jgi:hypothetical protein
LSQQLYLNLLCLREQFLNNSLQQIVHQNAETQMISIFSIRISRKNRLLSRKSSFTLKRISIIKMFMYSWKKSKKRS